jgi:hypothetical protein
MRCFLHRNKLCRTKSKSRKEYYLQVIHWYSCELERARRENHREEVLKNASVISRLCRHERQIQHHLLRTRSNEFVELQLLMELSRPKDLVSKLLGSTESITLSFPYSVMEGSVSRCERIIRHKLQIWDVLQLRILQTQASGRRWHIKRR